MNTAQEIRDQRAAYESAMHAERQEALAAVNSKWKHLFAQLQWECQQETGHRFDEDGHCILCGKTEPKTT